MNNIYEKISHETEVFEASPHRLVQLLLERCAQQIQLSRHFMESKDISKKCQSIGKAMDIIGYLQATLNSTDPETGELSSKLNEIYSYIERKLIQANLKNDITCLEDALNKLLTIKSGWDSIGSTHE